MGNICNVEPLQSKETKLEGYAPELTSAKAFSLLNNSPISNNSPYLFKKSGAVGLERLKDIVGASYVNNQLVDTNTTSVTIASGHKYVAKISGTLSVGQSSGSAISVTGGTDTFTDLTQLFGSASIADYIYSLETATAGAGIAKLKELGFDFSAYRAYDAGSIVSVKTSGLKVAGKNQLGLTLANIKALNTSGTWNGNIYTYYGVTYMINSNAEGYVTDIKVQGTASGGHSIVSLASNVTFNTNRYTITSGRDGGQAYLTMQLDGATRDVGIEATATFTKLNYIRIVLLNSQTANNTFHPMIRLASITDSTYEPYTSKTTPLSPIDLRGLYKIDANNNIYADGDKYKPSGDVSRKYGIVDLGSLSWVHSDGYFKSESLNGLIKRPSSNTETPKGLCEKFMVTYWNDTSDDAISITPTTIGAQAYYLWIKSSRYSDAATFKTAMSGVYLMYEKETPTAETAKPYPEYINIYQGGTEEFIDTRALPAPVGHDSDLFEVMTFDAIVDAVVSRLSNRSVRETPQEETTEEPTEDDVR